MITVLVLGIVGGTDSLQVASAMGLLGMKLMRRWLMVASLVFFDTTMTIAGLAVGHRLNNLFENIAGWLGPGCIMALGVYILVRELTEKEKGNLANNRWVLVIMPFMMSLDNLFAGLGLGTAGYPVVTTAVIMGLCSGGMSLLGLFLGEKLRRIVPRKIEWVSGLYLVGLAVFMIIKK